MPSFPVRERSSSFTSIGLAGGLVVAALAAIALIGIGIRRNRPNELGE